MSKIRINDLARELEVKSKAILDALPEVGVTEKKTHSSSVEEHEAEKVRAYLRAASEAQTATRPSRPSRADNDEIKTKIDLSNISRPGDVLNAIRKQQAPVSVAAPPLRPTAAASPAAPPVSTVKAAAAHICRASAAEGYRSATYRKADIFRSGAASCPATCVCCNAPSDPSAWVTRASTGCDASCGTSCGANFCDGTTCCSATAATTGSNETGGSDCAASAPAVAADDRSPYGTSSGVPGACQACCAEHSGSDYAPGSWTSSSRAANFPAPASGQCCGSGDASSIAPRRTSADASNQAVADGYASAWSWAGIASAGLDSSG